MLVFAKQINWHVFNEVIEVLVNVSVVVLLWLSAIVGFTDPEWMLSVRLMSWGFQAQCTMAMMNVILLCCQWF